MNNLAGLYNIQGRYEKAEPLYHQTLELSKKILGKNHPNTLTSMHNLAWLYIFQRKYDLAQHLIYERFQHVNAYWEKLLAGSPEKQRLYFVSQEREADNLMLSLALQLQTPLHTIAFSWERKGLLLSISSQFHRDVWQNEAPKVRQLFDQLAESRRILAHTTFSSEEKNAQVQQQRIKELQEKIHSLELEMAQLSPKFSSHIRKVSLQELRSSLKPKEALVDYLVFQCWNWEKKKWGEKWVLATIVLPEAEHLVSLGSFVEIEEAIGQYRQEVQKPRGTEEAKRLSQKLYSRLWQPLVPFVQGKERLYVVPDGALHLLPFSALCDEKGEYLPQSFSLEILSSPREVVASSPSKKSSRAVVFAGPDYNAEPLVSKQGEKTTSSHLDKLRFSFLPQAEAEGKKTAALLQASGFECSLNLDKEASKERLFQLRSPQILHIATHGFFLENLYAEKLNKEEMNRQTSNTRMQIPSFGKSSSPLQSNILKDIIDPLTLCGLALAGANTDKESGLLMALEVLALELTDTDLVVLSACETGVGKITESEGVSSLRHAFQKAGAKAVLSTLWATEDEANQEFMTRFYQYFFHGLRPQAALRQVQNEFIHHKHYNHPRYWACFVLTGTDKNFPQRSQSLQELSIKKNSSLQELPTQPIEPSPKPGRNTKPSSKMPDALPSSPFQSWIAILFYFACICSLVAFLVSRPEKSAPRVTRRYKSFPKRKKF